MTSREISREIAIMLKGLGQPTALLEFLLECRNISPDLSDTLAEQGDALVATMDGVLRSKLLGLGKINSRSIFVEIYELEKLLRESPLATEGEAFMELLNLLANFSEIYESFIKNVGKKWGFRVVTKANQVLSALTTLTAALETVKHNIEPEIEETEDCTSISLLLQTQTNLEMFAIKLMALKELYEELCFLANVSARDYPAQIAKIESGSLWARIFGERKVIIWLTQLIQSGIDFLHRNYTREGKIASIPKSIKTFASVMNLEKQMRLDGYDTEEMRDKINKAGAKIASNLNQLLQDQARIELNDAVYSVGPALEQKFLGDAEQLLLIEEGPDKIKDREI